MYAKYIKQEYSDLNGTGRTQAYYKMLCRPFRAKLPPHLYRGFTPACGLNAPSGLCGRAFPTSET